jgi:GntR family transcriptional repressor for pyruvate dehydrogenase complex
VFDEIVSGHYAVGDRLPTEMEISEAWGVSRPVVREALLRLRADGLVVSHQGLGTFVSTQPAPRIRTYARAQDVASYLRCQEVRIALESDAARLAALRRTDDQLQAIVDAHETFSRSVREGRMVAEEDLAFHARIVEAAGNDFYPQVLATIHETLLGFMRLTLSLTRTASKQRGERVLDEHRAILEAIRDGDGELARAAMTFHCRRRDAAWSTAAATPEAAGGARRTRPTSAPQTTPGPGGVCTAGTRRRQGSHENKSRALGTPVAMVNGILLRESPWPRSSTPPRAPSPRRGRARSTTCSPRSPTSNASGSTTSSSPRPRRSAPRAPSSASCAPRS